MTPISPATPDAHGRRLIAADVGGTHARVALVVTGADADPVIVRQQTYRCAEFDGLAAVLKAFVRGSDASDVAQAVIAIAGYLDGDRLINTNLPWPVSLGRTRADSGLAQLSLINDFEALAYAVPRLDRRQAVLLTGCEDVARVGPVLVLGPGTGLGAAVLLPGTPLQMLATEAGHAALAPGTEVEIDILRWLLRRGPHVDNEQVLSGPGLVKAYRALCQRQGCEPILADPASIVAAAQQPGDPVATQALEVFCALLGSLTGDLVLSYGACEVFIAGGIPSRITDFLQRSQFVSRYLNKGGLRDVLERVPVRVIEHGALGVIGAATWYSQRRLQTAG